MLALAGQPWNKNPDKWSKRDVQRILNASPWSHRVQVQFPKPTTAPRQMPLPTAAAAGMGGRDNYSGRNWDGGVQAHPRNLPGVPELAVLVRWNSAPPVRQALQKLDEPLSPANDGGRAERDYIITVIGLVPAGSYQSVGKLPTTSESGSGEDAAKKRNPEQMLEGLMLDSMLVAGSGIAIRPEDVKLEASTGALQFFFPRVQKIALEDGEAIFRTKFSTMTINAHFSLKDMSYHDRLAL